jgi:hypothetical protein
MLTHFGMIWNYNNFSRQNTWNFYKNNALSNIVFTQIWLQKNENWGNYKYNK